LGLWLLLRFWLPLWFNWIQMLFHIYQFSPQSNLATATVGIVFGFNQRLENPDAFQFVLFYNFLMLVEVHRFFAVLRLSDDLNVFCQLNLSFFFHVILILSIFCS
jgi:hypothetical protein